MDKNKVNQCVESLCQSGCEAVRATITSMEMELSSAQTHNLDKNECQAVLNELKSIMSVYDKPKD